MGGALGSTVVPGCCGVIHVSKLLRGGVFHGDAARFPQRPPSSVPVIVWHLTGACNLSCRHCYAGASAEENEMGRDEAFDFLRHAASLKPHAVLFSGGEPLAHPHFWGYLARAGKLGLRVSLSTNGTLIDSEIARRLADANVGYVGVSVDGPPDVHDEFRRHRGAFDRAMAGVRHLRDAGCRVGLRFTMARPLLPHLRDVMALAERSGVQRICFYHFIPTGSGRGERSMCPERDEMRDALRQIFAWAEGEDAPEEVLTVGNFADGLLLYLDLKACGDERAGRVMELLERGGGGRSGRGIVSVRWDGALFADQFSWDRPLGSWRDLGALPAGDTPLDFLGRCGRCTWRALCRGNMRARARALTGDDRGEDPGCPLTECEIA